MTVINLYTVLGLTKKAKPDDIKKAYYQLAKQYHPDKNKDEGVEDKFKEITAAYDVLKDEDKRLMYDIELRQFEDKATAQERAFEEYFEQCSTVNKTKASSSTGYAYQKNGTNFDFRPKSYSTESDRKSDSSKSKKSSDKTGVPGSSRKKSGKSKGEPKRTERQKQTFDYSRPDWNANSSHASKQNQPDDTNRSHYSSHTEGDSIFDDLDDLLSGFPHASRCGHPFKPMSYFVNDMDEREGRPRKTKKPRDPLEEMWDWSKPLFQNKGKDEFGLEEESDEDDSYAYIQRVPCYCCGRKFNPANLASHETACKQFFRHVPTESLNKSTTGKNPRDEPDWPKSSTDPMNGIRKETKFSQPDTKFSQPDPEPKKDTKAHTRPRFEDTPTSSSIPSFVKRNHTSFDDAYVFLRSKPARSLSPPLERPKPKTVNTDSGTSTAENDAHHHTFFQPGSKGFVFSAPDYVYTPPPDYSQSQPQSYPSATVIGTASANMSDNDMSTVRTGIWDASDINKGYTSRYIPLANAAAYGLSASSRPMPRNQSLGSIDESLRPTHFVPPPIGNYVINDDIHPLSASHSSHASPMGSRRSSLSSASESRLSELADMLTVPDNKSSQRSSPVRTSLPQTKPLSDIYRNATNNSYIPDSVASEIGFKSEVPYSHLNFVAVAPCRSAVHYAPASMAYPATHGPSVAPYKAASYITRSRPPSSSSKSNVTPPTPVAARDKLPSSYYHRHTAPRIPLPMDDLDFSVGLGSMTRYSNPMSSMPNHSSSFKANPTKKLPTIVTPDTYGSDDDFDPRDISPLVTAGPKFRSPGTGQYSTSSFGTGGTMGGYKSPSTQRGRTYTGSQTSYKPASMGHSATWSDLSSDVDDSLGYNRSRPASSSKSSSTHSRGFTPKASPSYGFTSGRM